MLIGVSLERPAALGLIVLEIVQELLPEDRLLHANHLLLLLGLWLPEMLPVINIEGLLRTQSTKMIIVSQFVSRSQFKGSNGNTSTVIFDCSHHVGKSIKLTE